ncbi:glycerol-3-phosphate dehydrogenase/oxidase [Salinisphaera sp. T31B1]|uniref:glycerol-3-phosphate dehydrogenase/oxidase n=1 Tax=Salinisphaera sp. T31B1 TaxID=727963 RepID=UPI00333FFBA9
MWTDGWRVAFEAACGATADVLVIGGGITGAGIALEAARAGARVVLVEQNDFASGTSSWSSKLVHGGLRYLAGGHWQLTRESVRERQRLMHDLPGLVTPVDFILPVYAGDRPGRIALRAALSAYDAMAGHRHSHHLNRHALGSAVPYLRPDRLTGGFCYRDAITDDVRLTLRVLAEARSFAAATANYVAAESLIVADREVVGARLHDRIRDRRFEIRASCVVNATGPWSDRLRDEVAGAPRLRPLRGSHFVFPFDVLPVARAVTLFHPADRRPVFALPWQGATVFGTTDLDHEASMDQAPYMSESESDYLIVAARHYFPALDLSAACAVSRFAGVRPVIRGEPGASASDESRESAIDVEAGLVSVTGGKLTTFRVTAHQALVPIGDRLGRRLHVDRRAPIFHHRVLGRGTDAARAHRYGPAYARMPAAANDERTVAATGYCMRELRFALSHEAVEHLDDLLLRRTRIGLIARRGGIEALPELAGLCQEALGWDRPRWEREVERYRAHWQAVHAPV